MYFGRDSMVELSYFVQEKGISAAVQNVHTHHHASMSEAFWWCINTLRGVWEMAFAGVMDG